VAIKGGSKGARSFRGQEILQPGYRDVAKGSPDLSDLTDLHCSYCTDS